jgi:AcrR family transcriptional regulator
VSSRRAAGGRPQVRRRVRAQHLPADERRRRTIAAAIALLADRGPRGCTTSALAAAAGISEAALFKHFPSVQALFDAALQTQADRMSEWVRSFDPGDARDWPAVAALIRHLLAFLERTHGGPLLMLVMGPVSRELQRKAHRSMRQVARRIAAMATRREDVVAMSSFAFAIVQSSVLRWLLDEPAARPTQLAEPMLACLERVFGHGGCEPKK